MNTINYATLVARNQIAIIHNLFWSIRSIEVIAESNKLKISGWALYQDDDIPCVLPLYLNDKKIDHVTFPEGSPGLARILTLFQFASKRSFRSETTMELDEIFKNDFAEITLRPYGYTKEQISRKAFYYCDPRKEPPFPPSSNIFRVIGTDNLSGYLLTGATAAKRIMNYLEQHIGRSISSFDSILDWGCGSGRIIRYLALKKNCSITGIDVDGVNIDWCRSNIKNVRFEKIPLKPPTLFQDESFDLIIGISVFTHLREADQFAWLKELKRMSRPGGIIMASYHGNTVMGLVRANEEILQAIEDKGIYITGTNTQVSDLGDKKYYVNVSHTRRYIEKNWGKYFEILDIIPAFLGRQDMVVMRA